MKRADELSPVRPSMLPEQSSTAGDEVWLAIGPGLFFAYGTCDERPEVDGEEKEGKHAELLVKGH